jgi:predicted O-linked N-acetylglucosamine transferase (SPINDLY family)
LRQEARTAGLDDSRLVFVSRLLPDHNLDRMTCADVFLDTWPCNAHTTAGEALWAAVPLVTLQGRSFAARVAASLLHSVGLPQLICHSADDYVEVVLRLLREPQRLEQLHVHLQAQRDQSTLFDGERFARDFEALLTRMWQRHLSGLPPEHLPAPAVVPPGSGASS